MPSAPSAPVASQPKPASQPVVSDDTSRKPVSKIITIGDVQIKYDGN